MPRECSFFLWWDDVSVYKVSILCRLRKLGTFFSPFFLVFECLSLSLSPWWGLSVQVNCSPKWSLHWSWRGNFHTILNALYSFSLTIVCPVLFQSDPLGKNSGPLHISDWFSLSLTLAQGCWHVCCDTNQFSGADDYLGNVQELHTVLIHYCCLCTLNVSMGVKSTTAHSFSPWCLRLLFLPSHLSSILCCQKTARRQGIGAGVITGRKGRKTDRRRDRERKGEAVCNNCAIESREVQSDGFYLLTEPRPLPSHFCWFPNEHKMLDMQRELL